MRIGSRIVSLTGFLMIRISMGSTSFAALVLLSVLAGCGDKGAKAPAASGASVPSASVPKRSARWPTDLSPGTETAPLRGPRAGETVRGVTSNIPARPRAS